MRYAIGNLLAFAAKAGILATLLVALAIAPAELAPPDARPASVGSGPKLPSSVHDLALFEDGRFVALRFPKQLSLGGAGDVSPTTILPNLNGIPDALAGPTADGRILIGFEDGVVRSWTPSGPGRGWRNIGRHVGPVHMLAVSPDGQLAAAAHATSEAAVAPPSTVTVWDLAAGTVAARITARGPVDAVGFSGDSERLITRGDDGTLSVWRVRGGEHLTISCGPSGLGSFASSPLGSVVATCVVRGNAVRQVLVTVSNVAGGDRRWETAIDLGSDAAAFHRPQLAFSRDGELLACGTADSVTLFSVRDGRVLAEADAQWHRVSALQFQADGGCIVSAGQDGTVRWWGLPDLSELRRCEDLLPD
jgi:WD40 repeat protein